MDSNISFPWKIIHHFLNVIRASINDTEKYREKLCAIVYTTSVDLSFLISRYNSCRSCSLAQPPLSRRLRREIKLFPNRPSYPPTCVTHAAHNLALTTARRNSPKLAVHFSVRPGSLSGCTINSSTRSVFGQSCRKWGGECVKRHSSRSLKRENSLWGKEKKRLMYMQYLRSDSNLVALKCRSDRDCRRSLLWKLYFVFFFFFIILLSIQVTRVQFTFLTQSRSMIEAKHPGGVLSKWNWVKMLALECQSWPFS